MLIILEIKKFLLARGLEWCKTSKIFYSKKKGGISVFGESPCIHTSYSIFLSLSLTYTHTHTHIKYSM